MSRSSVNEATRLAFSKALRGDPSRREIRMAKAVVISLAAPFIGLIFLVALPFIGLACCGWHGLRAAAGLSDRGAERAPAKIALRCLGSPGT